MKILGKLEKDKGFWFLLASLFTFFILRLPSLFEPYWYGDEGIYQTLGLALGQGRLLYRDIWDNKPPLLYLLYALFSSDQFMVRLVSLIFGVLSIIIFFALSKKLFSSLKLTLFTTSIFAVLFGVPLLEGNIANAENFMLLPILLSGLLIVDKERYINIFKKINLRESFLFFICGALLGLAFLFKTVAIFDTAAFFLFFVFIGIKQKANYSALVKNLLYFSTGFILPITTTFIFFSLNGALYDFINATFLQMFGYINYGNKYIIPHGLLLFKLLILTLFILFLFKQRRVLSRSSLFILLWFAFSLFNAFFAQRPYTHYLLVLLPSFSFLLGAMLSDEKKYQKLILALFLASIILIAQTFTVYGKTFFYYLNYISFIMGKKDVSSYQAFFDRQTPIDYKLAQYIKIHAGKKDSLFIWGNNAQIYKLTNKLPPGRYTVAYHMTFSKESFGETRDILYKTKPKYVIVASRDNPIPYPLFGYKQKLNLDKASIYESIF